jgi:hypothetical protein
MYRFARLPPQEEKCHHASLLMILDFDPLNAHFDFLMEALAGNSTVAVEYGMGI